MKHQRLSNLIDAIWDNSLVIQREHHGGGKTQIRILSPFWEVLHDEWYTTGATNQQCDVIQSVLEQYTGVKYEVS